MPDPKEPADREYLSPGEMRGWLQEETANAMKELELRLKEANEFVYAYSRGALTAKEADERYFQYQERWGLALNGISASGAPNDVALIAAIDESRRFQQSIADERDRELKELRQKFSRYRQLFGLPEDDPHGHSR